ncbi:TRAP transporter small permease [Amorphus coralli]|uniref:TRAP transporter small permease n=1 Tax=Amorphus coralli TaxID=340680 RepID=UPI0003613792|nr:TRAP transporter small permease [Amorphus coralli]
MSTRTGRQAARTLLDRLATLCLIAAIVFLAMTAGLIVLQVVCRNFFDMGLPWADELARFSGVSLVYLAVPTLALRGRHISVDLVPNALPRLPRRVVLAVNELAVFAFCALTLYGFHGFLERAAKFTTSAMGMPNWIFYAPPLIGIVLLSAASIARFIDCVSGRMPEIGGSAQP